MVGAWEDDGSYSESSTAMSDAEHYVELQLTRAASDVASDGEADAWLDEEVDKEGNLIVVSPRLRISSDKEDNTNKIGE